MATLPTRLRQNIRDQITSETSPLAAKTTALTTTLGYPITLDPEWTMLWKTLQAYYPDSSTFVPSIASTISTWCDAFTSWLENDENEEQVEKLLDALKGRARLEIVLEVSPTSKRPTTAWRTNKLLFVIALPKVPLPQRNTALAGFSTDLLNLFVTSPLIPALTGAANTASTPEDPDGWADLDLESPESHQVLPLRATHGSRGKVEEGEDSLPEVSTLQRPEELTRAPPYWLVVRQEGKMNVVVQSSHAPSLACLDEYLRRWCRGDANRTNRPLVVDIKLQESAFGLGLLNDTLTMEAIRGREVSAMLVLAFVEGVLGYTPVPSNGSAGSVWEFRRTKGFR